MRIPRHLSLLGGFLSLGVTVSFAASGTWENDFSSTNANWSDSTNWASGNVPGVVGIDISTTDLASFPAAGTIEQPVLDGDRSVYGLNVNNSLGSYNVLTGDPGFILSLRSNGLTFTGGGSTTIAPQVRIGINQVWNTGSTAVTLSNGLSYSGNVGLTFTNSTPVTIEGNLTENANGTLTILGTGSATISASIANGVTLDGAQSYSGTLRLSGSNSFSSTFIWRRSTLELDNVSALGTATLQIGSAVTTATANVIAVSPLTMNAPVNMTGAPTNTSITLGASHISGTTTFNGAVSLGTYASGLNLTSANGGVVDFTNNIGGGSAPINKVGAGVVRFTRALGNSYTGGTTIANGALLINNTSNSGTGTGAVNINSGGIFGGTGQATGAVTVNAGGTLSPGDSTQAANARAGTLSLNGPLAFAADSAVVFELNGTTAGDGVGFYDQIIAGNTVTLNGNIDFTLTLGIDPLDDGTQLFTLIDRTAAGAIAGPGLLNLNGANVLGQGEIFSVGGQSFQISYTSGGTVGTFLGGGNELALLAIPEPGTATIAFAGLLLLAGARRRVAKLT